MIHNDISLHNSQTVVDGSVQYLGSMYTLLTGCSLKEEASFCAADIDVKIISEDLLFCCVYKLKNESIWSL